MVLLVRAKTTAKICYYEYFPVKSLSSLTVQEYSILKNEKKIRTVTANKWGEKTGFVFPFFFF